MKLICHPASPCAAISTLHVSTSVLADGGLQLCFQLRGQLNALCIPASHAASAGAFDQQRDELWRHTCFEAFIATAGSLAYREFNFSPSGHWAAYAFTDARQRDSRWQPQQAPRRTLTSTEDSLSLEAYIPAALLPVITQTPPQTPPTPATLHIGLAAVIEASDGTLSYWALTHTGERPDFHQRAAFTLELPYDSTFAPHIDQQ